MERAEDGMYCSRNMNFQSLSNPGVTEETEENLSLPWDHRKYRDSFFFRGESELKAFRLTPGETILHGVSINKNSPIGTLLFVEGWKGKEKEFVLASHGENRRLSLTLLDWTIGREEMLWTTLVDWGGMDPLNVYTETSGDNFVAVLGVGPKEFRLRLFCKETGVCLATADEEVEAAKYVFRLAARGCAAAVAMLLQTEHRLEEEEYLCPCYVFRVNASSQIVETKKVMWKVPGVSEGGKHCFLWLLLLLLLLLLLWLPLLLL